MEERRRHGTSPTLVLAGGIGLSMHYARAIRENRLSAHLLKAHHRADVAVCDRGRLGIRIDSKGRRFGERGQYVPVLGAGCWVLGAGR